MKQIIPANESDIAIAISISWFIGTGRSSFTSADISPVASISTFLFFIIGADISLSADTNISPSADTCLFTSTNVSLSGDPFLSFGINATWSAAAFPSTKIGIFLFTGSIFALLTLFCIS